MNSPSLIPKDKKDPMTEGQTSSYRSFALKNKRLLNWAQNNTEDGKPKSRDEYLIKSPYLIPSRTHVEHVVENYLMMMIDFWLLYLIVINQST